MPASFSCPLGFPVAGEVVGMVVVVVGWMGVVVVKSWVGSR